LVDRLFYRPTEGGRLSLAACNASDVIFMLFNESENSKNCPFPWGIWTSIKYVVFLDQPDLHL